MQEFSGRLRRPRAEDWFKKSPTKACERARLAGECFPERLLLPVCFGLCLRRRARCGAFDPMACLPLSGWLVSARCRRAWPRSSGRHLGGLALSAPLRARGVAPMLRAMQASLDQPGEHAPRKRMVAGSVPAGGMRPTDGQGFRGRARGWARRIRPACGQARMNRGKSAVQWRVGKRPCELIDKALASGAKDCRRGSCQGHFLVGLAGHLPAVAHGGPASPAAGWLGVFSSARRHYAQSAHATTGFA